jgi:hypothetical protein
MAVYSDSVPAVRDVYASPRYDDSLVRVLTLRSAQVPRPRMGLKLRVFPDGTGLGRPVDVPRHQPDELFRRSHGDLVASWKFDGL